MGGIWIKFDQMIISTSNSLLEVQVETMDN